MRKRGINNPVLIAMRFMQNSIVYYTSVRQSVCAYLRSLSYVSTRQKGVCKGFVLAMGIAFASCSQGNTVYFEFQQVHPEAWSKDSLYAFPISISDTTALYDLYIYTRNTPGYPYQNIWLFISSQSPDNTLVADTIEFFLADHRGRWLGTGMGDLKEMPVLYKQNLRFPRAGTYIYTIGHGMRDDTLRGINDVGMKVERRNRQDN